MSGLLRTSARLFDALEHRWKTALTRRVLARCLTAAFLVSVILIELSRLGWLPHILGHPMPTNHFHAISWTVTLLLIVEVLDLVFGLAGSVSRAIGKQLEIFSLVLLRKTFDELPRFPEPIVVEGHWQALERMGVQAGGALAVFAILIVFYRIQKRKPLSSDATDVASFIAFKKLLCLVLLAAFCFIGAVAGVQSLTLADADSTLSLRFFELFYTILVFADVLVVLASLSATLDYPVVFRNFGYAVVTICLRLALAAEPYLNALIGTIAAAFALAISFAYVLAWPRSEDEVGVDAPASQEGGESDDAGPITRGARALRQQSGLPAAARADARES